MGKARSNWVKGRKKAEKMFSEMGGFILGDSICPSIGKLNLGPSLDKAEVALKQGLKKKTKEEKIAAKKQVNKLTLTYETIANKYWKDIEKAEDTYGSNDRVVSALKTLKIGLNSAGAVLTALDTQLRNSCLDENEQAAIREKSRNIDAQIAERKRRERAFTAALRAGEK